MARKIEVQIVGDTRDLERALSRAGGTTKTFGSKLGGLAKSAAKGLGLAGLAGAALVAKRGFDELRESQAVMAQTVAAIKSTGGAAKVTAKEVADLASEQSRLTGIDDELIQTGSNLLLTFTKVRNEVGKGNDIFNQATVAALDLSKAGFGSVETTSKQLGKALQDPIRGMTALRRAGVVFTESQEAAITKMVETGNILGAQKLILAEVNKQVGGSAKAWGETLPGKLAKAQNAFDEASGKLMEKLLPALTEVATSLVNFIAWLEKTVPAVRKTVTAWASAVKGAAIKIKDAFVSAITFILGAIGKFLHGLGEVLHAAGKMPGPLGEPFRKAAAAVDRAAARVDNLQDRINNLHSKTIHINAVVHGLGSVAALREHISLVQSRTVNVGARQHGGPVTAGRPYLVGERGPELFVPRSSGGIVPNGRSAGGGGGAVQVIVVGGDPGAISYLQKLDRDYRRRSGGRGILG